MHKEERTQHEQDQAEYLAAHPQPTVLAVWCSYCKVRPGEQCTGSPRRIKSRKSIEELGTDHVHAARMDVIIRAWNMRGLDAVNYADNKWNEREGRRSSYVTDRHIKIIDRARGRN